MSNILSKQELMDTNLAMLGKGAPVTIDNVGYNQSDYAKMAYLSKKTGISDNEAYVLSSILLKYTNTQLKHISNEVKATIAHYQHIIKEVRVVDFNKTSVQLSWNFDRDVSNAIKTLDRKYFKWLRPDGEWVLDIQWNYIEKLLEIFAEYDFSTTSIQMIFDNLENLLDNKENLKPTTKPTMTPVKVNITRPSTTVDTLVVDTRYNIKVVEAFKRVPYMFYNSSDRTWETYIEFAAQLYKELEELQLNLDLSELKPWSDLVKSWGTSYELLDISNFKMRFTPYEFQPQDARKLMELKVGLNANDMGCGKTFEQVIIGESIPMKKLVICPPTLRLNWKREIQNVNPQVAINILYSDSEYKVVNGWNIIGYNSLDKFLKRLEKDQLQVIMIDEAHYIQAISNAGLPESKRAYAVLRLAATAQYVYPITGTPKTNRNKNLFNILRVIRHPLSRGKWAFSSYGKTFCNGQRGTWGWDYNGNSNDEELNRQLEPFMVRHLKKDVLPHLKKQRIVTPVEVDLSEYHYEITQYLSHRTNKYAENLARLMRARKILATQKVGESIDFAKDLIGEDKKVVIVTCFSEVVKAVEKAFSGNVVQLVGGMTDEQKDKAIIEFQTGKSQVMVMNIVAGGVGVTLTKSYNMIINDFDWTPGNLTQAEDRICRSGQTEEYCNIYYLYASGADMDEIFANTLTSKFDTINTVVDGGNGDAIDYISLIDAALEKSTGIKKVRKIVKTEDETSETLNSNTNFKEMSIEELEEIANKMGANYKFYENPKIYRMRIIMAIKKVM